MKSVSTIRLTPLAGKASVVALLSFIVAGCDSSSATLASPELEATTVLNDAVVTDPVSLEVDPVEADPVEVDSVAVDPAEVEPVVFDSAEPTINSPPADIARTLLADRAAVGSIRIMPVGDSITHGVRGAVSYRRELTSMLDSHSCSFEMVGSQQTSKPVSSNVTCEDTGVLGDGWGWNGTESCLVDEVVTDGEVFFGAHEGYGSHRADHFLTGHTNSSGENAGIGASMASFTPEVVLVHLGSVDVSNDQTVASTLQDIEDVIATIHSTQPQTLVLLANVIPWFRPSPSPETGADIALLGDMLEQWVVDAQNPMVRLVDVRSGFLESMMISDQVHPNEIGEAFIAEAFMGVIDPLVSCDFVGTGNSLQQ